MMDHKKLLLISILLVIALFFCAFVVFYVLSSDADMMGTVQQINAVTDFEELIPNMPMQFSDGESFVFNITLYSVFDPMADANVSKSNSYLLRSDVTVEGNTVCVDERFINESIRMCYLLETGEKVYGPEGWSVLFAPWMLSVNDTFEWSIERTGTTANGYDAAPFFSRITWKTIGTESINGHDCYKLRIDINGQEAGTVWVDISKRMLVKKEITDEIKIELIS